MKEYRFVATFKSKYADNPPTHIEVWLKNGDNVFRKIWITAAKFDIGIEDYSLYDFKFNDPNLEMQL